MENLGLVQCKKLPVALPATISVDDLNGHFVSSSVNPLYDGPAVQISTERCSEPFTFSPITNRCVSSALARITTRACGPDNLPIQAFKTFKELLKYAADGHFHNSLLTMASIPSRWKSSIVVPIAKVCDPTSPSDFRPISLLCALSKVLERIVYDQLVVHLAYGNYLDPRQVAGLVFVRAWEYNQPSCAWWMTTFPKPLTPSTMRWFYGSYDLLIYLTTWLSGSNLTCRTQVVCDPTGVTSGLRPLLSGVPQGSVLGPLLFTLFVNNLPQCLSRCRHLLYADDLVIYLSCLPSDMNEASAAVNADIESVWSLSARNRLSLNVNKTKAMVIGSSKYINAISAMQLPSLCLGGHPIDFVTSLRTSAS
ncbi:uncharacterized protein LOC124406383 [Diprion similis]|uniref:uncharacterized protein LOC124406383 n=1 Tax=Diprion similis TaxID=362088 RepID=UPI001EF85C5B|nr:uncharacterized protein LOC124406383 [Diprion similis]